MRKTLLFSFLMAIAIHGYTQKVTIIDSSDLVIIDGTEMFYLLQHKSDHPLFSSFELQNLKKKTIAIFEYGQRPFSIKEGEIDYQNFYKISFPETGDFCEDTFLPSVNMQRVVAKKIYLNKLIENDELNFENEKTYVMKNRGFVSNTTPTTISKPSTDKQLTLVDNNVHNSNGLLLMTKKENIADHDAYSLYDKDGEKIAFVSRQISTNEDWKITMNDKVLTLLFNPSEEPLLYITRFLISKKLL